MTEQEIIQGNITIALFMGYIVGDYQNQGKPIYNGHKTAKTIGEQKELWGGLELQFTGRFTEYVQYPFNTDWNYIMPVVAKLEQQKDSYEYEPFLMLRDEVITGRVETTYQEVINCINHLNEQNEKARDNKFCA